MYIFLDSRDLIDCVEKHRPCGGAALARQLRDKGASVLLTFTVVLETRPRGKATGYVVKFYRTLESLPHVFVPHTHIGEFEFREAVAAFLEERRPRHVLPFATSWSEYIDSFAPRQESDPPVPPELARVPLSAHVEAWLTHDQAPEFAPEFTEMIDGTVKQHRQLLGSRRAGKKHLLEFIESQLDQLRLSVPNLNKFSKWLLLDPGICPGWRLLQETFEEFRVDVGAKVASGDVPDMTHLF
ncbi:MAG TPA: hypothetical protein VF701_18095 [Thermoanaerobaculia bacterium]